MAARDFLFTAIVTVISRGAVVRDRVLRRLAPIQPRRKARAFTERLKIASDGNVLDAVLVRPAGKAAEAAVLLCHGIGEAVEHWYGVQLLLAEHGAASLVFDYTGYGRSTGWVTPAQCERDAVAAFARLQERVPGLPVTLLGFSMGSGVAAAIVNRVQAARLLLCAAFTSFHEAAYSMGVPRWLGWLAAPVWRSVEELSGCAVPVTVVHGERDRMFPVAMAEELAAACGAELVLVPELGHNQPFYQPELGYWGLILTRIGCTVPASGQAEGPIAAESGAEASETRAGSARQGVSALGMTTAGVPTIHLD